MDNNYMLKILALFTNLTMTLNPLVNSIWDALTLVVIWIISAHKLALIEPLIQSAGASVLNLSPILLTLIR